MTSTISGALYRTIWRWHFYAGLLILPIILILSVSGAVYLYKPQIDRWEERAFANLPTAGAVAPSAQVAAALAAYRGAQFVSYRLPDRAGDAAMVHLALPGGKALTRPGLPGGKALASPSLPDGKAMASSGLPDGKAMRDVFVSPQGHVLGTIAPENRIIAFDRRLHGQLLMGRQGSWLVELAASWAIVLILSGLYLWWPRDRALAGVLWPRLSATGRVFWRDLHAVTGFWVSGLALVLLASGLPWADVWGSAFKTVRAEMGWVKGAQDWTTGGRPAANGANGANAAMPDHADHDHAAMMAGMAAGMAPGTSMTPSMHMHHMHAMAPTPPLLDTMVARARAANLAFPVLIVPPGAGSGEGGGGKPAKGWLIKSESQNRPLRTTLRHDANGQFLRRDSFASRHPIDRVVAYGTAWHEGQLFGWVNQLIGTATALMLVTLVISGFTMWRRRRPAGTLGAPAPLPTRLGWPVKAVVVALMLLLPLFTLSLVALALLDWLVLARMPRVGRWLGV